MPSGSGTASSAFSRRPRKVPLAYGPDRPYLATNGDVDASQLRRWYDHSIARMRRMYARPLLVVVSISGPVLARFPHIVAFAWDRCLGMPWRCGYTLAA